MRILISGGTIVTSSKQGVFQTGDILISGKQIEFVGQKAAANLSIDQTIDAKGCFVIPGLIQAHTHLCQTLFRGLADDLSLLDWLKKRILPMEAAHSPQSLRASAMLGCLEMQLGGTTAIVDMGTVSHTHHLLSAVSETGMRYWGGKCLMDFKSTSGPLYQPTNLALSETEELIGTWHNKNDLINYALCPRFVVSCSDKLLEAVASLRAQHNLVLHTHASENKGEVALVKKRTGYDNIAYLNKIKLLTERTVIAHGIHVSMSEVRQLAKQKSTITHCPSSNLKLSSGIARIERYRKAKVNVALGADGAPCNNMLDIFVEMRLAALLQKPLLGPKALPAKTAFEMATLGGARAVARLHDLGSLAVGKLADIVIVDRSHPSVATVSDPYSALVYSCTGRDVRDVMVNGKWIVRNRSHQLLDQGRVLYEAKAELNKLLKRMSQTGLT